MGLLQQRVFLEDAQPPDVPRPRVEVVRDPAGLFRVDGWGKRLFDAPGHPGVRPALRRRRSLHPTGKI